MPVERPRRPARLRVVGKRLWDAMTLKYDFGAEELALLGEIAHVADALVELQAVVSRDGATTADGKVAPALVELRLERDLLGRLIGRMTLVDDSEDLTTLAARLGSKGAAARWRQRGR